MNAHHRLVAATRLGSRNHVGPPQTSRPDRWPGSVRLAAVVALAVIGWSVILLPIL